MMLEPATCAERVALGGPRGAKMRPKWHPRRTKIEDKNEDEKRRLRRCSWNALGAILVGLLSSSWAVFCGHGSPKVVLSSTRRAEARNLGRFGDPKWNQEGTQNAPKSKTKTKMKKEGFEDALGTLLGRSWAASISKIVLSPRAGLVFLKNDVFEQIKCQEATWAELGPTWASKRVQNGAPKRAKTEQNKTPQMK